MVNILTSFLVGFIMHFLIEVSIEVSLIRRTRASFKSIYEAISIAAYNLQAE